MVPCVCWAESDAITCFYYLFLFKVTYTLAGLKQLAAVVSIRAHNSCNMKKVDKNVDGFGKEGHVFKEVIPFTDTKGKEGRKRKRKF